tara:strand:+ start:191 stop:580 length:390 start_codon:yes stop_codon:yes gene_type:complete
MGQKAKNAGKKQSKTKPVNNDIDLKALEELMGSCLGTGKILSTTVRIPKQDHIIKQLKKHTMLGQIGMYWLCNSQDEDSYYFKTIKQEEFENKYLKYINNTGDAIAHYREEIKKRSLYVIDLEEKFIIA